MKEIKNTTTYTKEIIKKFLQIYYFERIKTIRIILNILIIIIILSFFIDQNKNILDFLTFIFALFGIVEVNTNMLPTLNYYKLTKQKNSIIDTKINYVFKKNNFKLNKDEYIDYHSLKKVIETDTSYYLYINNSRCLIVDKISLNDKEITSLTNIFKKQVTTYKYKQ